MLPSKKGGFLQQINILINKNMYMYMHLIQMQTLSSDKGLLHDALTS